MRSPVAGDLCILQMQRVLRSAKQVPHVFPCFPHWLEPTEPTEPTEPVELTQTNVLTYWEIICSIGTLWDIICDKIMSDVRIKFDFSNYAENNGLFVGNPGNWELPK